MKSAYRYRIGLSPPPVSAAPRPPRGTLLYRIDSRRLRWLPMLWLHRFKYVEPESPAPLRYYGQKRPKQLMDRLWQHTFCYGP